MFVLFLDSFHYSRFLPSVIFYIPKKPYCFLDIIGVCECNIWNKWVINLKKFTWQFVRFSASVNFRYSTVDLSNVILIEKKKYVKND